MYNDRLTQASVDQREVRIIDGCSELDDVERIMDERHAIYDRLSGFLLDGFEIVLYLLSAAGSYKVPWELTLSDATKRANRSVMIRSFSISRLSAKFVKIDPVVELYTS